MEDTSTEVKEWTMDDDVKFLRKLKRLFDGPPAEAFARMKPYLRDLLGKAGL